MTEAATNNPSAIKQVTAGVIRRDGRILLAQRKDGHLAGKWEFPGGKIEPGETPETCLRRELHEEFEIEVRVGEHIATSVFEYKELTIELMGYEAEYLSGDFVLVDHSKIVWVEPKDLPGWDLAPADIPIVEAVMQIKPD